MNVEPADLSTAPRSTKLALAGLAVGVLGLVIQWIADPAKFPGFPPGIIMIVAAAAIVAFGVRWWWTPVFSVLAGTWIVGGGFLSAQLTANLASGDAGTVAGNVVMSLGLIVAAVAGILAMIEGRRRLRRGAAGR
ncbi:hypothetical protein [Pseudonocardia kunmingensis]|uniref:SPW repeat-containing protein n=1 Tax=Pseudonocardia kunmingensis TaxID=630975 RepID=A0A543CXG3_9PSEU|nr:hypothetical protein [Pseudonocardia kunmingensis]TQM01792.1 hypothetical protein FB558_8307 [Pseudonocardia kunmingensis]